MIFDRLDNAAVYHSLGRGIARGLAALGESLNPLRQPIADGRHEIDGENLFAIVQTYQTKPREQGQWEAHERYVDIQYVVEGTERMGFAPIALLTPKAPYDREKDLIFFDDPARHAGELDANSGQFLAVSAGSLAIFFPHDAHMPSLMLEQPARVRKIVVKVAVELLGN